MLDICDSALSTRTTCCLFYTAAYF